MYPLTDFWSAIMWLETNTHHSSIVLSKITAGNYIPAYAGNFVYLGHNPESPFFDEKVAQADRFFSGQMTSDEAKQFIKK